jgi:sugar lactone lactonase YvrE
MHSARAGSLGFCFVALFVSRPTLAQTYYEFTTFAGSPGNAGHVDGAGNTARFDSAAGVTVDASGNLFVTDGVTGFNSDTSHGNVIRKITPNGDVTTIAGLAGTSGHVDGTGSAARFNGPCGLAVDRSGNLFVADNFNFAIRKISAAGVVTTPADVGLFFFPQDVAVDASGNVFVTTAHTIRKMDAAGVVTTFAGEANTYGDADGTGSAARFGTPSGLAIDASGNLFVAQFHGHTIRKITPAGVVTTVAGLAGSYGSADGVGSAARFYFPGGVAVDVSGNVFVADCGNHTIRKITPGGVVTTVGGTAGRSGSVDGPGNVARFLVPSDVAVDASGNLYVTANYAVLKGVPKPGFPPAISTHPQSQTIARGRTAVFNASATGSPAPKYQWTRDGITLAGASDATFIISSVTAADAGTYQCIVTNAAGSAATSAASLIVAGSTGTDRFSNFSVRVGISSGRGGIAGFAVDGTRQKTVLVRGIGPALAAFGVSGTLADPKLEIFSSTGQRIAENDNWPSSLASIFTFAGAFALPAGGKDAALLLPVQPGAYTIVLSSADGSSGEGAIEIYEVPGAEIVGAAAVK